MHVHACVCLCVCYATSSGTLTNLSLFKLISKTITEEQCLRLNTRLKAYTLLFVATRVLAKIGYVMNPVNLYYVLSTRFK